MVLTNYKCNIFMMVMVLRLWIVITKFAIYNNWVIELLFVVLLNRFTAAKNLIINSTITIYYDWHFPPFSWSVQVNVKTVQTVSTLNHSYIPEDSVQIEFSTSQNLVHMWWTICK